MSEDLAAALARQNGVIQAARDLHRQGHPLEYILLKTRELDDSSITAMKVIGATQNLTGLRDIIHLMSESATWSDRREEFLAILAAPETGDSDE